MKSSELTPSFDNLFNSFHKDTIGRDRDIWDFCKILNSIEGHFSIAIDGSWGSGKTFFVKQTKLVLDALNPNIVTEDSSQRESILRTCDSLSNGHHMELQPQVCVYYDAWKNDNDVDPILSLVYSILSEADTDFHFSSESKIFSFATAIAECVTGRNIKAVFDSTKTSSIFDRIHSDKSLESEISAFLDSLLPEKGQRLVVFVDELDRCKPTYAIQVLERIKHYFCNDRITFVFSINAKELEHTIGKYYGTDFDSGRYLDRFFDLRIALPKPNMDAFYRSIAFSDSRYWYDMICRAFIDTYHLSMREISRYISATKLVNPNNKSYYYSAGYAGQAMMTMLPIMIGLKLLNASLFESFVSGHNSKPLLDVAKGVPTRCYDFLLSPKEVYEKDKATDSETVIRLEDRLNEYYHAIFSEYHTERDYEDIQIGSTIIEYSTISALKHAASGLVYLENV